MSISDQPTRAAQPCACAHAALDVGDDYRFTRLSTAILLADMSFARNDLGPGDAVPDFDLPTIGRRRFRSRALIHHRATLMVFGSSTCPMTDNCAPGLKQLHRLYGARVAFVMVNVREAHPGARLSQPDSIEDKIAHARYLRDLHDLPFDVAVDDIEGSLHRAFGAKPNAAYLIGLDGVILFRAHWANETTALEGALKRVAAGQKLKRRKSSAMMGPMIRMLGDIAPVLDRAGAGAWSDLWRAAAPLAVIAALFSPFSRRKPA
ncbi:MAG: redoxin domain-containing protein [Proteobacteria bacterium]|nr:redoxin domain-containing protein [Pseudomonadota bacterium]